MSTAGRAPRGRLGPVGTFAWLVACGGAETETMPEPEGPIVIHLGAIADANGEGSVVVDDVRGRAIELHLDGEARVLEIDARADAATLSDAGNGSGGGTLGDPAEAYAGGVWFRPRSIAEDQIELDTVAATSVTISVWGKPPPEARRERSLVWVDPAIVDDPAIVGLSRVTNAAALDGDGGRLLDAWFRRFATTAHSERAGPAQLMDELAATFGTDPSLWDLDALPFKVTAVHNRLDLGPRNGGCGELRVSFASTHPVYAPLHVLFLFRQDPRPGDIAPSGEVHCLASARRWARLAELDGGAFAAEAKRLLDETLVHDRFALAESVELTVSPWEWRQWLPDAAGVLDNPPLFQTVATATLNQPGAVRESFLGFVAANAAALDQRTLEIPASFRSASASAPPSVPREALSLAGLDTALLRTLPNLAYSIEIVGCPACHTTNASFVQTNVDRSFSPFYDKELDARAARLDAQNRGQLVTMPPFGPLQTVGSD